MKRLSTQCMNEIENKTNRNRKERKTMPRRQTLDFLTPICEGLSFRTRFTHGTLWFSNELTSSCRKAKRV